MRSLVETAFLRKGVSPSVFGKKRRRTVAKNSKIKPPPTTSEGKKGTSAAGLHFGKKNIKKRGEGKGRLWFSASAEGVSMVTKAKQKEEKGGFSRMGQIQKGG